MSSQRIAIQHDHIRMSTSRKGLELALGAQQLRPPRTSPRGVPHPCPGAAAFDTRRPSFMLKPAGFSGRNPTLDVPAPGGHCQLEAS
jgi:hypothetical protein